jgi:Na+/H+-dicarboxylate symporter
MLKSLSKLTNMTEEEVGTIFTELPAGEAETPRLSAILKNLVLMLFTDNLFAEALNTNLLPLIVFSIIFAGMLTTMGSQVDAIKDVIEQSNHALMNFVLLLMKLAPLGIFCLVASRFGEAQMEGKFVQELQQIGWYVLTVLLGLGFHAFVTLPLIFWIFRRENPYAYMMKLANALLTAFSTASSSATLPITMESTEQAGVSKRATEFVLPLGATINMDGTALYEAAAAIFIAQAIGADMGLVQQTTVAITATLAAIGAAGIPEAGLVTMLIVLNAVGLPAEYVGLIIPVDWLLDRFRTATNTWGDSVGAAVVEKTFPA